MNEACLYVVATPIGNRADISLRAIEVLKSVDVIAAEDTRHSKRLLQFYEITTPLISLHEHNEAQRVSALQNRLLQGESVALISDAGTPLISDPGARLVFALQEQGIRVIPVPGACAAIVALSVSGLPTERFCFEGFLSSKSSVRRKQLAALVGETRTLIFYESPHRIVASLTDFYEVFGPHRKMALARELTKTFETIRKDTVSVLLEWVKNDINQQKGEFVLIVEGQEARDQSAEEAEAQRLLSVLLEEVSLKQAVGIVTRLTNCRRQLVYSLALALKNV